MTRKKISMEALKRQRSSGQRLTRKRIPLSCVACRVRKLKCNREKPCQNCVVRGESNAASCTYAEKPEGKHLAKLSPRSDSEDMRKRIDRLEKSILSVISSEGGNVPVNRVGSPSTHVTEDEQTDEDENTHQMGGQKISADTRSTHWDAILNELGAMKDAWSEEYDSSEVSGRSQASKSHRPSLLSGLTPPPKRSTVVASLPTRDAADKLIARFFSYYNPAIPARYIIHKPTFIKQYTAHWADPSRTRIIWIGLFFGIMCHALQSYGRNEIEPPEYQGTIGAMIELYRIRAAQCLLITDVTKPVRYMIEAMLVYSMTEYADESDDDMGTFLLSGYVLRLALQQGYHRDPSQHPNISVFDGEMRRRIWSCVSQHELLFSEKVGLPKGIRYSECDTTPPRNLNEDELFEDMTELPPSRPDTEQTDLSYFVTKQRVMLAYGKVIEFLHILEPQPYEEVLRLDSALRDAHESVPPHLRLISFEEMQDIPSRQIMESCMVHAFSHKAVCLLHRKYWNEVSSTKIGLNNYSRERCVGSSIALLDQQAAMHHACQPGGILSAMRWYQFAIINHDFLLAAVIICLDLMMVSQATPMTTVSNTLEKINAVKRSIAIWAEVVHCSRDAKRAVTILTNALNKVLHARDKMDVPSPTAHPSLQLLQLNSQSIVKPELPTTMMAIQPTGDTVMQEELVSSGIFFDNLVAEPNLTTNFDWDAWDQYLATQPLEYDMKLNYS